MTWLSENNFKGKTRPHDIMNNTTVLYELTIVILGRCCHHIKKWYREKKAVYSLVGYC